MSKVDKVKAEYAERLKQAEAEDTIAAHVPSGARSIHVHPLDGTVATVNYGDPYVRGVGAGISWDTARAIVAALPPVGLTMVKDGCTSIRARAYCETLPEEKKERWLEEIELSPIYLDIDKGQFSLHWVARTPVGLVRVDVFMGYLPPKIANVSVQRREFKGGFAYDRPKVSIPGESVTAIDDSGEPLAQMESPIIWASGGSEYPSRVTLYFVDLGAGLDPARVGACIVEHLAKRAAS